MFSEFALAANGRCPSDPFCEPITISRRRNRLPGNRHGFDGRSQTKLLNPDICPTTLANPTTCPALPAGVLL
jgi:hypothetical protein